MTKYYQICYNRNIMSDIAIVTAKVDANLKRAAQQKARQLGVPLSAVLKKALRDFVVNRRFSIEELSQDQIDQINESLRDYESGDYICFPAEDAAEGLRNALKNLDD